MKIMTKKAINLKEELLWGSGSDKILVIPIAGFITDEDNLELMSHGEQITSTKRIEQYVDKIRQSTDVKAVLLIINSPGGSAAASDNTASLLEDLRPDKHVVAFVENLGASGAYYIACSAERIIAAPASLVGSIGVTFSIIEIHELLAQFGIKVTNFSSGPFKDSGSRFRELKEQDREYLGGIMQDAYWRFVNFVATMRRLSKEQIAKVIDGKIFPSQLALDFGLIDEVGYLNQAITAVKEVSGLDEARFIRYKQKISTRDMLSQMLSRHSGPLSGEMTKLFSELVGIREQGPLYLWKP